MAEETKDDHITIDRGGSGYLAVHVCTVIPDDGSDEYLDRVSTGVYRGNDRMQAVAEAKVWAASMQLPFKD